MPIDFEKIKGKKFYDEDGEEVLDGDELEKEFKERDEKHAKELKDKEDALAKIENDSKNINFKKLKEMTEEEKKKFTEKELKDKEEKEALLDQIESIKSERANDWKEMAMSKYSEEERSIIEKNMDLIKDTDSVNSNSRKGLMQKVEMAAKISGITFRDPISDTNYMGGGPVKPQEKSSVSPELKSLASDLGITEEDFKKAEAINKSN